MPWPDELDDEIDQILNNAPQIIAKPFEEVSDYIEQKSVNFRLIRNEFQQSYHVPVKRFELEYENNKNKAKQGLQLAHSTLYHVALPQNRSFFSKTDMEDLYAVHTFGETQNIPTQAQRTKYIDYLSLINMENDEFLQHTKKRWLEECWTRTNVIKEDINDFISLWWKARIGKVKNYPQNYVCLQPISLTPSEDAVKLVFLQTLKQLGKPPRYYSSANLKKPTNYNLDLIIDELSKFERGRVNHKKLMANHAYGRGVYEDETAESYALEYQAQLVTTPSVLSRVLANNPASFEESWCIPFRIKEYNNSGDQTRKIIFMDKKLPPKHLSATEKNAIFAKVAARNVFKKSTKSLKKAIAARHVAEQQNESENEEDDKTLGPSDSDPPTSKLVKLLRKSVSYNLWECTPAEDHSVLSKHHKKPFKLLIKTSIKGSNAFNEQTDAGCVLLPILEYQPEYGAALASFKELTREWLSVTLRPNSFLHRVRIDPVRGSVAMIEAKNATMLASDCQRLHSRSVQSQLSVLQVMFDTIIALPPGNYLLSHELKDKGFMYIYHEQEDSQKKATLNLWEQYESIDTMSTAKQVAPWTPLDTSIITPTFHSLKRIPCVFAPAKNFSGKRKLLEPLKRTKRRQAKKKKKEKKKEKNDKAEKAEKKYLDLDAPAPRTVVSYDNDFLSDNLNAEI